MTNFRITTKGPGGPYCTRITGMVNAYAQIGKNSSVKTIKISGTVLDAYVAGATGYLADRSNEKIPGTDFTTDDNGNFEVDLPGKIPAVFKIIVDGGTDILTGDKQEVTLSAIVVTEDVNDEDLTVLFKNLVVNPLTRIQDIMVDSTSDNVRGAVDDAEANIKSVFGLGSEPISTDYIQGRNSNTMKASIIVNETIKMISRVTEDQKTAAVALGEEIENGVLDLQSTGGVEQLAQSAGVDETTASKVALQLNDSFDRMNRVRGSFEHLIEEYGIEQKYLGGIEADSADFKLSSDRSSISVNREQINIPPPAIMSINPTTFQSSQDDKGKLAFDETDNNRLLVHTGQTWQAVSSGTTLGFEFSGSSGASVGQPVKLTENGTISLATAGDNVLGVVAIKDVQNGEPVTVATNGTWKVKCVDGAYTAGNYLKVSSTTGMAEETTSTADVPFATILETRTVPYEINGEAVTDNSGHSVAINSTGDIIAIGAKFNDGDTGDNTNDNRGHVRVFKKDPYTTSQSGWTQVGEDIDGEAAYDNSGYSVAMNNAGTRIVVGATGNDGKGNSSGHVRVWEYRQVTGDEWEDSDDESKDIDIAKGDDTGDTTPTENKSYWIKVGQDIDGEAAGDQSGYSVAMNYDGDKIAVGATRNGDDDGENAYRSGHVRVWIRDEKNTDTPPIGWRKLGKDIDGEEEFDESGNSVAMNYYGTIVAIGSQKSSGRKGKVKIYEFDLTVNDWTPIGDITGDENDRFGSAVSLNKDGNIIVIGSRGKNVNRGQVRVYQRDDDSGVWNPLGDPIDGKAEYDQCGYSVDINDNGDRIVVGSPESDNGHVRVYDFNGSAWIQVGGDIDGEALGDQSGYSVAMNSTGTRFAVGAIGNDADTGVNTNNHGHVRIYDIKRSLLSAQVYTPTVSSIEFIDEKSLTVCEESMRKGQWPQCGVIHFDNFDLKSVSGSQTQNVQMSSNGKAIAVQHMFSDANGVSDSGKLEIFYYSNEHGEYKLEAEILGTNSSENFSKVFQFNREGTRLYAAATSRDRLFIYERQTYDSGNDQSTNAGELQKATWKNILNQSSTPTGLSIPGLNPGGYSSPIYRSSQLVVNDAEDKILLSSTGSNKIHLISKNIDGDWAELQDANGGIFYLPSPETTNIIFGQDLAIGNEYFYVGAPKAGIGNAGKIYAYSVTSVFDDKSTDIVSELEGEEPSLYYGYGMNSFTTNKTGNILVVGESSADYPIETNTNHGYVRVYELVNNGLTKRAEMYGFKSGDDLGHRVSMNSKNEILVSSVGGQGDLGNSNGYARILKYDPSTYELTESSHAYDFHSTQYNRISILGENHFFVNIWQEQYLANPFIYLLTLRTQASYYRRVEANFNIPLTSAPTINLESKDPLESDKKVFDGATDGSSDLDVDHSKHTHLLFDLNITNNRTNGTPPRPSVILQVVFNDSTPTTKTIEYPIDLYVTSSNSSSFFQTKKYVPIPIGATTATLSFTQGDTTDKNFIRDNLEIFSQSFGDKLDTTDLPTSGSTESEQRKLIEVDLTGPQYLKVVVHKFKRGSAMSDEEWSDRTSWPAKDYSRIRYDYYDSSFAYLSSDTSNLLQHVHYANGLSHTVHLNNVNSNIKYVKISVIPHVSTDPRITFDSTEVSDGPIFARITSSVSDTTASVEGGGWDPDNGQTEIKLTYSPRDTMNEVRDALEELTDSNGNKIFKDNVYVSNSTIGDLRTPEFSQWNKQGILRIYKCKASEHEQSKYGNYENDVITVQQVDGQNKYHINGVAQKTLYIAEGDTLMLDIDGSFYDDHPFKISTQSDGTHSGGTELSGVLEINGDTITIDPSGLVYPQPEIYYYCRNHSGMGGKIILM